MTVDTKFAQSVETIKLLMYRVVWPSGGEELLTGTEMLERGIAYLNADCVIYEYEHVSQDDRAMQQQLENIYHAAYTMAMKSSSEDDNPELTRIKDALDEYHQARLRKFENQRAR
jgi:hypothetical protein